VCDIERGRLSDRSLWAHVHGWVHMLLTAWIASGRACFVARATAGAIHQLPPVAPDVRGHFDAQAAADAATLLSLKRPYPSTLREPLSPHADDGWVGRGLLGQ
jgi:hypothetical protein